jgi:hypothetical protein
MQRNCGGYGSAVRFVSGADSPLHGMPADAESLVGCSRYAVSAVTGDSRRTAIES